MHLWKRYTSSAASSSLAASTAAKRFCSVSSDSGVRFAQARRVHSRSTKMRSSIRSLNSALSTSAES